MKKLILIILLTIFLTPKAFAAGSPLLHWVIKREAKAQLEEFATKIGINKPTQKEIKKEWKRYKKAKKKQEKLHKKKLKRIEKKKKEEEKKKFELQVQEAKKLLDTENFEFLKYNDPQGSQELDFFGIYGKRQVETEGVISPDFSKMIYSEVHFYPSECQITSEMFLLPLPPQKTTVLRVMEAKLSDKKPLKFYKSGMSDVEEEFFRTMTMVDWSSDGSKILAKERISENLRGFLETRVWVYELETQKTYYLQNLKQEIEAYWEKQGLDLAQYKWDISPMGWNEGAKKEPSNELIVYAYGYKPDKTKVFLGGWLANYKNGEITFIKNTRQYKASQNGLVLRKKINKE